MLDQLKNIFKIIQNLFDLIVSFFSDLGKVAELIADTALEVPKYISIFFPGDIAVLLVTGISVVIIYKVAGRT